MPQTGRPFADLCEGVARRLGPALMGWRFGAFGSRTFLNRPYRITHPDRIYLGSRVTIRAGGRIEVVLAYAGVAHDPRLEIGDGTIIEQGCHLVVAARMQIGPEVLIGPYVLVTDCEHGMDVYDERSPVEQPLKVAPVVIGRRVFIGAGARILKGVRIGDGAVIGANAVVTADVGAGDIVGGVPARSLRKGV